MKALDNPIINQRLAESINEDIIDELIEEFSDPFDYILEKFEDDIRQLYTDYLSNGGNPHVLLPHNTINDVEQGLLEGKFKVIYDSPPKKMPLKDIFYHIRKKSSPNLCPMCGSSKIGTVDHYLPKSQYPLYSIYLYNLVPACDCNGLRKTTIVGNMNERVLHPYFDKILLNRRLLTADLTLHSDETISIDIKVYEKDLNLIEKEMVNFHLKNIVLKTNILDSMADYWGNIKDQPDSIMYNKPNSSISGILYYKNVKKYFRRYFIDKNLHSSWESILLHGILKNRLIIAFLADKYNHI